MKAAVIQRANSPLFLKNAPSRSPNPEKSLSASTPAGFATAILSLCWDSLLLRIPHHSRPRSRRRCREGRPQCRLAEGRRPFRHDLAILVVWTLHPVRAGHEVLCREMQVTGVTKDGGYQEFMVAPVHYVAPLPDGLDFAEAGPLMCGGLTVFNGLRQAGSNRVTRLP